ncbi:hypothetical protein NSPZN2_10258 [Nitrospira defluvii]|uniref:Uncharacterized protein n=1 Tax=Nitrospira defluvii TaxID=330214 RepID=A0ABM8QDW0_9BACT|nr:hypothetical protein NSPZN2_10258 [Nitrospira defluvii]
MAERNHRIQREHSGSHQTNHGQHDRTFPRPSRRMTDTRVVCQTNTGKIRVCDGDVNPGNRPYCGPTEGEAGWGALTDRPCRRGAISQDNRA